MIEKICAVVPIKDTAQAKQRLAGVLSFARRRQLALAMAEDVLRALTQVRELACITVVTVDPAAAALAARIGAQVSAEHACEGHTAAIAGAAQRLAATTIGMLALPADIPMVEPDDIRQLVAAHRAPPAFTIVPASDEQGSNAVLCSPANAVSLRFGENSFFPHLAAARAQGIEPQVLHLPRMALDIDTPADLVRFLASPSRTHARVLLDDWKLRTDSVPEFDRAGA